MLDRAEVSETDVYERILEDLASGHFDSGVRLKVQALATRYGTSINPVREALRKLQGEGLVEFRQNRGAVITKVDSNEITNIFEFLSLLEPYFVAEFARSCTTEEVDELVAVQEEIEATSHTQKAKLTDCDSRFHDIFAIRHYNARAVAVWRSQRRILGAFTLRITVSQTRYAEIVAQHRAIIEACRRNDADAARSAIEEHLAGAGAHMYAQLRAVEARERSGS
jgi:DNA-binding GntR family transcriptional regulator